MNAKVSNTELAITENKPSEQESRPMFAPGFYTDISNEDYHRSTGVSSSSLKNWLTDAPNETLHKARNPKEPGKDQNIGTLLHTMVLEPEELEGSYVIKPEFNRRTKLGKAEAEAWEKANEGRLWVTKEQLEQAKMMALSVEQHSEASHLLQNTINESSVYYWYKNPDTNDDREYKQICKVRPDAMSMDYPMLLDVKTCEDAGYEAFQKSINKFFYHLSASMYLDGVNSCPEVRSETGWFYQHFVFIAVSKKPAFDPVTKKDVFNTAVYSLDSEGLEMGRFLYRKAMQRLHDGKAENYPGLPSGIRDISLPPWGKKVPSI